MRASRLKAQVKNSGRVLKPHRYSADNPVEKVARQSAVLRALGEDATAFGAAEWAMSRYRDRPGLSVRDRAFLAYTALTTAAGRLKTGLAAEAFEAARESLEQFERCAIPIDQENLYDFMYLLVIMCECLVELHRPDEARGYFFSLMRLANYHGGLKGTPGSIPGAWGMAVFPSPK
jgi:hypothetical protein